jgi:hypothetical protein
MLARIWRARPDPVERETDAVPFSLVTSLRGPGGPASVLVRSLSSTGFSAEALARFSRGTKVWINLPAIGEVGAVIAQNRSGGIAAEFLAPIAHWRCIEAVNGAELA